LHFALSEDKKFRLLNIARTQMHGDLHTGNIICRLESDRRISEHSPQIIDLALYEPEGHAFFDLAYLEFDLLIRCLPIENSAHWADWLAVLRHLNVSGIRPEGQPPGVRPAAAFELVQPIRLWVTDLIEQIKERSDTTAEDYVSLWWVAAMAAGLSMSRSRHAEPWKRSAALIYAAWAAEQLVRHLDIAPGKTQHTLEWEDGVGLRTTSNTPIPAKTSLRLGKLLNVPSLDIRYLERQQDIERLADLVLASERTALTSVKDNRVAVQGMGGIGKTVLAAMLCNREEVVASGMGDKEKEVGKVKKGG
jgi:hypothetical protein